jgi:hypothetical protein
VFEHIGMIAGVEGVTITEHAKYRAMALQQRGVYRHSKFT